MPVGTDYGRTLKAPHTPERRNGFAGNCDPPAAYTVGIQLLAMQQREHSRSQRASSCPTTATTAGTPKHVGQ